MHCTLHNYHKEARELDAAYGEFRRSYCDACPDKKPRPDGWELTDDAMQEMELRNYEYVARLAGTEQALRYTDKRLKLIEAKPSSFFHHNQPVSVITYTHLAPCDNAP